MWRSRLIAIGWGGVGVLTALLLWHLWTDHVAMHTMLEYLNRTAVKINKLP